MSPRRRDDPIDVSPERRASAPFATWLAVIFFAFAAGGWATRIYFDVDILKADNAEIKERLARIERKLGTSIVEVAPGIPSAYVAQK